METPLDILLSLREDVGFIKAKVAIIDDLDKRVDSLEKDNAREMAVIDVRVSRKSHIRRFRSEIFAAVGCVGAVLAGVAPLLHF